LISIQEFLYVAKEDLKWLQKDYQQSEIDFNKTCEFLGEDPTKKTPEELFGIITEFLNSFEVSIDFCYNRMINDVLHSRKQEMKTGVPKKRKKRIKRKKWRERNGYALIMVFVK
jgi:hypothetical protein